MDENWLSWYFNFFIFFYGQDLVLSLIFVESAVIINT